MSKSSYQVLQLRAREDLVAIAMKRYSASPKAQALLKPHHQIVLCHILDTCWGSLTPLQKCSQCILQPQLTGPDDVLDCDLVVNEFDLQSRFAFTFGLIFWEIYKHSYSPSYTVLFNKDAFSIK